MPLTPAEKQKAYRERQQQLKELASTLPLDASSCKSLEQYVLWHRRAAEVEADRREEDLDQRTGRIKRAEDYARWRWQQFRVSEVAAL